MNCRSFYSMYFSGCLHKRNIKVAFILIFKVAALNAYNFGILNVNQQRKRGFVFKGQDKETGGLRSIPSTPVILLGDLGHAAPCASVSSAWGGETCRVPQRAPAVQLSWSQLCWWKDRAVFGVQEPRSCPAGNSGVPSASAQGRHWPRTSLSSILFPPVVFL